MAYFGQHVTYVEVPIPPYSWIFLPHVIQIWCYSISCKERENIGKILELLGTETY